MRRTILLRPIFKGCPPMAVDKTGMQPTALYFGDDYRFVENEDRFAMILEEKLGRDAAEYFREAIANPNTDYCAGECDHLYKIQESYERILKDIQDALMSWKTRKWTKEQIEEHRDQLLETINKEL